MHEASIVASLLERLRTHPELAGRRVLRVRMRIGRLAAVVPESLEFLFGAMTEGTDAQGARLEIADVPALARCHACDHRFEIEDVCFLCPRCGDGRVSLESGREIELDEVDVE